MRNPKVTFLALGAYVALVAAFAVTTSRPATGQNGQQAGPDVRVINTPAEPVPVTLQGAAQIDTSSPLPVRDVDRLAREPVTFRLLQLSSNGQPMTYTVPTGKRLVIEYLSGRFRDETPGNVELGEIFLNVDSGGNTAQYYLPGTLLRYVNGVPEPGLFAFSEVCRIYASAGDTVEMLANHGFTAYDVRASGYLVDAP